MAIGMKMLCLAALMLVFSWSTCGLDATKRAVEHRMHMSNHSGLLHASAEYLPLGWCLFDRDNLGADGSVLTDSLVSGDLLRVAGEVH